MPAKGSRKPDRLKFMPKRAVRALLTAAFDEADWDAFLAFSLAYWLGLREGEVADLHAKDFDLAHRKVWVRTLKRSGRPALPVQVPAGTAATDTVTRALATAQGNPSRLVFPGADGKRPRSTRWFRGKFEKYRAAARLPAYTFHSLRHAHGTLIATATKDPVFVRDQLRHRSVTTTDVYMRNTKDYSKEMGTALDL